MTAEEHFVELCQYWRTCMETMRDYLRALDGETSRKIGRIVMDIEKDGPNKHTWPETSTASFIKTDSFLWHEVANSRKL